MAESNTVRVRILRHCGLDTMQQGGSQADLVEKWDSVHVGSTLMDKPPEFHTLDPLITKFDYGVPCSKDVDQMKGDTYCGSLIRFVTVSRMLGCSADLMRRVAQFHYDMNGGQHSDSISQVVDFQLIHSLTGWCETANIGTGSWQKLTGQVVACYSSQQALSTIYETWRVMQEELHDLHHRSTVDKLQLKAVLDVVMALVAVHVGQEPLDRCLEQESEAATDQDVVARTRDTARDVALFHRYHLCQTDI